jgi:hypothetical protein
MLTALAERPTLPTFPAWLDALLEVPPDVTTDWPLLATPVPTGFPAPVDDQVERHLSLDEHLIHNPGSTFLMRVQGDDWWEQGIHHGDLLVVDRAIPPSTGSWVVAVLEGEFALRNRRQRGQSVGQGGLGQVTLRRLQLGGAHDATAIAELAVRAGADAEVVAEGPVVQVVSAAMRRLYTDCGRGGFHPDT